VHASESAFWLYNKRIMSVNNNTHYVDLDNPDENTGGGNMFSAVDDFLERTNRLSKLTMANTDLLLKSLNKKPTFDSKTGVLKFKGKDIGFKTNKNQAELLRVVFNNTDDLFREWCWDEVITAWGDEKFQRDDKKSQRMIYDAGYNINDNIAKKTTVNDFLLVTKRAVRLNPKYFT